MPRGAATQARPRNGGRTRGGSQGAEVQLQDLVELGQGINGHVDEVVDAAVDRILTSNQSMARTAAQEARRGSASRSTPSPGTGASRARGKETAKEAIVAVLTTARGPLATKEIAARVLKRKGVALGGVTPDATIASILATENAKGGLFQRTAPGQYKLRSRRSARG